MKLKSDVKIPKALVFWIDLGILSSLTTGETILPVSSCFISSPCIPIFESSHLSCF